MTKKKEKKIPPPGKIIFKDNLGGIKEISAPCLVSLFWSEKMQDAWEKAPTKRYSIKELLDMAEFKPSESALRGNIKINIEYFKTEDTIRYTKQGLMSIKVAKLKPIVEKIFEAVKKYKTEYDE